MGEDAGRKLEAVLLEVEGVVHAPYGPAEEERETSPGALALMARAREAGLRVGPYPPGEDAEAKLRLSGLAEGLAMGAAPVAPGRAALVARSEAALAAATQQGFAQVVGVEAEGGTAERAAQACDLVVADPAELEIDPQGGLRARTHGTAPSVWQAEAAIRAMVSGRRVAVFLDYDGTLAPIVPRPEDAVLAPQMRAALGRLAARLPVAIVSGRDLDDVRAAVDEPGLYFAGSHGFDLAGPGGWRSVVEKGRAFLPALSEAAGDLEAALAAIPGARVERKRFSLAVHYRAVAASDEPAVADALTVVMRRHPQLKASGGKKVYDVKPRTDWHKGRAVLALLGELGLAGPEVVPIYLGDDTTDEDAFRAIADRGLGLVVRDADRDRRTAARYALEGTGDVERFLVWLADTVGR